MGDLELRMGRRIRSAREDVGLTQEEVAGQLGMSSEGYGHFERGARQIGMDHLLRLSEILRRPVSYLLDVPDPCGVTPDEQDFVRRLRRVTNPEILATILRMVDAAADRS